MTEPRYIRALERNLAELSNAILKRSALIGIDNTHSMHALDFFRIANHALYNDMLSHIMKVFDEHKECASFWWCKTFDEKAFSESVIHNDIDINKIKGLSGRFKNIRNKTHFHIDKNKVSNPKEVWKGEHINGDEVKYLLESGFRILSYIYKAKTGKSRDLPDYDGSDVPDIIRSYKTCFPNTPIILKNSFD